MKARNFIAVIAVTSIAVPAFAQTQRTFPSAYPTFPTMRSGWPTAPLSPCPKYGFNPTSPCYSGKIYPSYSAIQPFGLPSEQNPKAPPPGSESLDKDQALLRIGAKGYLDIYGLEKDQRGIWRGKAALQDGRLVDVTLDLEGNIYSVPSSRLHIRIEPAPSNR
jgi:hypothetical protein